jgi:polar amino acid transport system permease protein
VDGRPGGRARAAIAAALPQPSERRLAREAARRARTRRQAAIAAASTVLVLGLIVTAVVTSEGWPNVRETFFSPSDFADAFPDVLDGFWLDVRWGW